MGFATLCIVFIIGIVIASLITNLLRTIFLTIGSLGLVYYFFIASPEKQKELDQLALEINFSEFEAVKSYTTSIKETIDKIGKEEPTPERDARFIEEKKEYKP